MSDHKANEKLIPLKITLFYIFLGGLWILLSDRLLITLVSNRQTFGLLEILKGWLFILITASFLYYLIQRGIQEIIQSQQSLKENLVTLKNSHQELAATKEILNQQLLEIQTNENKLALAALHEKEHYQYMFENMINAVAVYRVIGDAEDFILTNFNRAAETMDNLDRRTLIGRSILCNFPSAENNGYLEALTKVWRSGRPQQFPVSIIKGQHVVSYRENYITKLPTGEVMLIYEDITVRKQAEEAVWQEKERAQVTLHSIGDAVITTDVYGNIDYLNPVAEDLTGWSNYSAKGVPSQKVFKVISENTAYLADNSVEICLLYGNIVTPTNYTILIHREGYRYTIEHSAAPIRNQQGLIIGAVLAFRDVTDKKALQQQLSHQTQHDSLTGLPNRLLLTDRLTQALVRCRRKGHIVAVLFLDLDRFRPINDTLGHTIGDALLQETSQRLSSTLREGDTIARHGGDEFAILIPELTHAEDAAIVAQKTLDVFTEPFMINDQEIFITTSIGISLYPADGIDSETLIKHADTALSHAKIQGRNNYQFFTTALN
ncbi:MAG: diguanylate cyclase, partial [Desulfitobacteriaceae bacterium]